jgi:hypothetical protein
LSKAYQIPTYKVFEKSNYCRHWAASAAEESVNSLANSPNTRLSESPTETKTKKPNAYTGDIDGLWIYCFPNTGINCYEPAWYSMRVIPLDKNKTRLEYEIFAKKGLEETKIQDFIKFLKEVEKEVKGIC